MPRERLRPARCPIAVPDGAIVARRSYLARRYGDEARWQALRRLWRTADLTQEELADRVGWDIKTIQRAERGESVSGQVARDIAIALNAPLVDLMVTITAEGGNLVRFERISDGHQLLERLSGGHLYSTDAESATGDVADLVRDVLDVWDWSELWSELSAPERCDAGRAIDKTLKALFAHGWEVLVATRRITYANVPNMVLNILRIQEAYQETGMFSTAAVAAAEPAVMDEILDTCRKGGARDQLLPMIRDFYRVLAPDGPVVKRAAAVGIRPEILLRLACSLPSDPLERTQRVASEAARRGVDADQLADAIAAAIRNAPSPPPVVH